ncbi:hypothetical protein [Prevotella sp. KH2C16]|uniref:hypothetical protein n=1 Tax=Prevotella sp. KH2C16 TaxID=1855325 RepID=UPI0008F3372A|nr:hypothetical protein [Prevotella sp. KH2C16]SFG63149.1 hypothetical protein SAMN05216383_12412 [Prevotella sp. KH2C16]
MKKKEYIQPQTEVIIMNGDSLMDGEWWSVGVNPDEEIEDDDIGAKPNPFGDDSWAGYQPWED